MRLVSAQGSDFLTLIFSLLFFCCAIFLCVSQNCLGVASSVECGRCCVVFCCAGRRSGVGNLMLTWFASLEQTANVCFWHFVSYIISMSLISATNDANALTSHARYAAHCSLLCYYCVFSNVFTANILISSSMLHGAFAEQVSALPKFRLAVVSCKRRVTRVCDDSRS